MKDFRIELKKRLDRFVGNKFQKLKIGYDYYFNGFTMFDIKLSKYYNAVVTIKKKLCKVDISHRSAIGYVTEHTINFDTIENGVEGLVEYIEFKDIVQA